MQGVPLPVVAQLPGRSKVTMTLRYAHTGDREIEVPAERIGARFQNVSGFPTVPRIRTEWCARRWKSVGV
ncbi:MAG: hypothetical protein OXN84_08695 [Albidovulum sp.]|nr:hypothetical protein [Albidovulum sp.]